MRWGFQVLPDVIIVRLFGTWDKAPGEIFEKAAQKAVLLNKRKILLDFSEVEAANSLGILFWAYGLHHFQKLGIPTALIQPPSSLLPVLQNHGLNSLPSVFMTVQDARMTN